MFFKRPVGLWTNLLLRWPFFVLRRAAGVDASGSFFCGMWFGIMLVESGTAVKVIIVMAFVSMYNVDALDTS